MLREEGYELTLVSRTPEKVEAAAAELGAHAVAANVGRRGGVRARSSPSTASGSARLDVLVNSAGVGIGGHRREPARRSTSTCSSASTSAACLLVTQAAIPLLQGVARLDRQPRLDRGHDPDAGLATYGATKAAVIRLTRSLNAELDADGVRAIAICPGFVDTPMAEWSGLAADEMIRPEDCAEIVRMCLRLSPTARVPQVVIERVGSRGGDATRSYGARGWSDSQGARARRRRPARTDCDSSGPAYRGPSQNPNAGVHHRRWNPPVSARLPRARTPRRRAMR